MKLGLLDFKPVDQQFDLVALPVRERIEASDLEGVYVAAIDATLADTAAFCEHYQIGLEVSANCVIVEAKRGEKVWHAACIILATNKADVNGVVRRHLDARKISFAPMDTATSISGMEYGGITPIGLPAEWPVLIDESVVKAGQVIVGSGLRSSKILVDSATLALLPGAEVLAIAKAE